MLTRARLLFLVFAAAAALALASCGGGGGGGGLADDDPATLAPADAAFYMQATLRPKGSQKSNVEGLAKTISGFDDPFGKLVSFFDTGINKSDKYAGGPISFEKDINPWLGSKAGLFVPKFGTDAPAAGIVQTTDKKATQKFIADSQQKGDHYATYKGLKYGVSRDGSTAYAVVNDFLVIGAPAAFKQAVDVSEGADPLSDNSQFTDALDKAPSGSIADGYLDADQVAKSIEASNPGSGTSLKASLGDTAGKSAMFSVVPNADSVELDATTDLEQNFVGADLSSLIETFPQDSFAAVGIPDLGGQIKRTIDQLDQSGVPGINRAAIEQQLSQTGLSLDDITSALGDVGVFAGGSDRASLQGAAVIEGKDPEAVKKLSSKITTITGLAQLSGDSGLGPAPVGTGISVTDPQQIGPQPLIFTTLGDKIAIGYGKQATVQALKGGGSKLSDDPTYKDGVDALGGNGVSGYVSLPGVFKLADNLGAASDPDYQRARQYLQHLSYLIFGSGDQGDSSSTKVVLGVQP
jgi:hypothetical protein